MTSSADWLVVAGFALAVLGFALRIVMMRASDAHPAGATTKKGRELLRSHRSLYPKSRLPIAMWIAFSVGLILLIAGLLLQFR